MISKRIDAILATIDAVLIDEPDAEVRLPEPQCPPEAEVSR